MSHLPSEGYKACRTRAKMTLRPLLLDSSQAAAAAAAAAAVAVAPDAAAAAAAAAAIVWCLNVFAVACGVVVSAGPSAARRSRLHSAQAHRRVEAELAPAAKSGRALGAPPCCWGRDDEAGRWCAHRLRAWRAAPAAPTDAGMSSTLSRPLNPRTPTPCTDRSRTCPLARC